MINLIIGFFIGLVFSYFLLKNVIRRTIKKTEQKYVEQQLNKKNK
jgi:capsular polysaccharide biosynthesis protein